jgi:hypothetical protein
VAAIRWHIHDKVSLGQIARELSFDNDSIKVIKRKNRPQYRLEIYFIFNKTSFKWYIVNHPGVDHPWGDLDNPFKNETRIFSRMIQCSLALVDSTMPQIQSPSTR